MDADREAWLKNALKTLDELSEEYSWATSIKSLKAGIRSELGELCYFCVDNGVDDPHVATHTYVAKDRHEYSVCKEHVDWIKEKSPEIELTPIPKKSG